MRELELDGTHDDGEHIVLRDGDGGTFVLPIDDALRAAVRRDRSAAGGDGANEPRPLRPKEIQAMLRGGRSAEEISEIAQVDIDHVRRYEGPVLAEREFVAQRARGFRIGKGDGERLGEMVADRLAARHALETTTWDAWRLENGSWALELSFRAGGRARCARWVVDLTAQSVQADDDEARWLALDEDEADHTPVRARLTAVKSAVYDQEAPQPPRRSSPSGRSEHPSAIDEAELDALNARRGLRPVRAESEEPTWTTLEEDEEQHHPDTAGSAPSPEPEGSADAPGDDPGDEEPDPSSDADEEYTPTTSPASPPSEDTVDLTPLPGFDDQPSQGQDTGGRKSSKSGAKRPTMPSWDEIVFGSKHD